MKPVWLYAIFVLLNAILLGLVLAACMSKAIMPRL
jgi:hypothetical protein